MGQAKIKIWAMMRLICMRHSREEGRYSPGSLPGRHARFARAMLCEAGEAVALYRAKSRGARRLCLWRYALSLLF